MIALDFISHIILALFLAFGLDYYYLNLAIIDKIFYYPLITFGALLPDVDTPRSFIGRIIPLSYIIYKIFKHRTITHSFVSILVVSLIASLVYGFNIIILSIALGCIFHILGDLMTPQGVAFLYPLTKRKYCQQKYKK